MDHPTSERQVFSKVEVCSDSVQSEKSLLDSNFRKNRGELILEESKLLATFLYQKNENTRKAYETDIKQFFAFFKGKTLKDISSAYVVVYFKNHPELKSSTRARIKSSLSSLFKFCVRQRYLEFNPCEHLDSIRVPDQTQFRVLDIEEVKRMIELEENPRNKFFISLLGKTGIRISEAISLTFENFKKRDGMFFLIVVGKGSKTRTVKISEDYFNTVVSFKFKEGVELSSNTPVFRSKKGLESLSRVAAWRIIKNAANRAGLSEKVSPHWLRHFHATYSLKIGDDLRVIQKTLGHSSIVTTTKYTAVSPEQSSGEGIVI